VGLTKLVENSVQHLALSFLGDGSEIGDSGGSNAPGAMRSTCTDPYLLATCWSWYSWESASWAIFEMSMCLDSANVAK